VMASVSRFLTTKLRLTVNEAKSAVARPEERKFLGFSISNDGSSDLDAALEALAQGNSAIETTHLTLLDHALASLPGAGARAMAALRGRASILTISEALTQHAAYFDAEALG